jgi:hypothetical protein
LAEGLRLEAKESPCAKCRQGTGGAVLGPNGFDMKEIAMQMLAFLTSIPAARRRQPGHDIPIAARTAAARLFLAVAMIGVVVVGLQIASEDNASAAARRIAAASFEQGARP